MNAAANGKTSIAYFVSLLRAGSDVFVVQAPATALAVYNRVWVAQFRSNGISAGWFSVSDSAGPALKYDMLSEERITAWFMRMIWDEEGFDSVRFDDPFTGQVVLLANMIERPVSPALSPLQAAFLISSTMEQGSIYNTLGSAMNVRATPASAAALRQESISSNQQLQGAFTMRGGRAFSELATANSGSEMTGAAHVQRVQAEMQAAARAAMSANPIIANFLGGQASSAAVDCFGTPCAVSTHKCNQATRLCEKVTVAAPTCAPGMVPGAGGACQGIRLAQDIAQGGSRARAHDGHAIRPLIAAYPQLYKQFAGEMSM